MKYLLVSDIHGCLPNLEKVIRFFNEGSYDMMLILGDIMNYGPRNGVPEGLDAQGVAAALNQLASKIAAIRGNCDSEVDQMLLSFPCMGDYAMVVENGTRIFMTHGHRYKPSDLAEGSFDVFVSGHTHLWSLERKDGAVICNTGSITFPKQGKDATFATLDEDSVMRIRDLDGSVLASLSL